MQDALISVIVPVYKVEKYIHRCINSLLNQTYKNLEIIFVDDGSPDNCGMICDEYAKQDKRIKVMHKENGGVSSARNLGLEKATGDYITFVDPDDWIENNTYEEMVEQIRINNVDIVKCSYFKDFMNSREENGIIYNDHAKVDLKQNREEILDLYISGKIGAGIWSSLIKKEIINKIELFNTNLAIGEDLIFMLEILCASNSIFFFNKSFYHYDTNPTSATLASNLKERNMLNFLVINEEVCRILNKYFLLNKEREKSIAFYCFYFIYINLAYVINNTRDLNKLSIIDDCRLELIIKNLDVKQLSICGKIFMMLIKKKKKHYLYYFCIIFHSIRKMKI